VTYIENGTSLDICVAREKLPKGVEAVLFCSSFEYTAFGLETACFWRKDVSREVVALMVKLLKEMTMPAQGNLPTPYLTPN
jgi:hypothetical protein